jgi:hypothetical protein
MGLLAPQGDVDKVLETVVNNLEVSNNLDIQPEVRCRVLLTSTLESFTIGHTIVLSRGLIDVLPDEASLATMLAQLSPPAAVSKVVHSKTGMGMGLFFGHAEPDQLWVLEKWLGELTGDSALETRR